MPSQPVVAAASLCQIAVPFISLVAYLPQWAKLFRSRSSASISVHSWCAWSVSSAFALFYAIVQLLLNGRGWALVVSASVTIVFVLFTLFLVARFRPAARSQPRW